MAYLRQHEKRNTKSAVKFDPGGYRIVRRWTKVVHQIKDTRQAETDTDPGECK